MTNPIPLYTPSNKISARIVDGQLIILKPGDDELLRFNEVASSIWSVIEKKPTSLLDLVTHVVQVFEIDSDTAQLDITSFLDEMMSQTLVNLIQNAEPP